MNSIAPIFCLLTDFGYDFAVGCVKGVILLHEPRATIIDLDHSIEKFNIRSAAFVLAQSYRFFPKGSIFLCVVDPGVGTERDPLCLKTEHYTFVGPNNGIFDCILGQEPHYQVYQIDATYYAAASHTFHGRDLFAPAAIDFYKGNLTRFKPIDNSKLIHLTHDAHPIVIYIDSYGNIKTNQTIDEGWKINDELVIHAKGHKQPVRFVKTFQDVSPGTLLCYKGSNGTLEIAVNQGSAAQLYGFTVGSKLIIERTK